MRFILFMGDDHYPSKPEGDMVSSFAAKEEAVECMDRHFASRESEYSGPDWAQILDTETMSWDTYDAPPFEKK